MKFRILKSIIIPVAIAGTLLSCKKDKEQEALPSLEGKVSFFAPEFIKSKSSLTLTPKGAVHPDGKTVGYYWKISSLMEKADTTRYENGLDKNGKESDGTFVYNFPDTVGTFSISCYSYANGFSGISALNQVTVVDNRLDGSITGREIKENDPKITDKQGNTYYYTTIGDKDWFRNNLCSDGGAPFRNSLVMSDVFGKFYSYEEAVNACPEGWRLPTEEDWLSLAMAAGAPASQEKYTDIPDIAKKLMANAKFNTKIMWEYWREVGEINNETKMAILPVGYANLGVKDSNAKEDIWVDLAYPDATFKGVFNYAAFWTADTDGEDAYYRYLHVQSPDFKIGKTDKRHFGASVRCVRDHIE